MAALIKNNQFPYFKPALNGLVCFSRKSSRNYTNDDENDDDNMAAEYMDLVRRGLNELEPSIFDPRDEPTSDRWVERNPSMIRLTGKHPFNAEPPLTRLMHHGFITPVPLHYVRNHGVVPKATWHEWTVEVTGLVKRPTRFTMDQLATEFQALEFPVTLVCSANRRKEQNMVKQTTGFNWGPGAISTSVWRGVRLCDVLNRCGIYSSRAGEFHVQFEGGEDLPGGGGCKYATSLRREIVMDESRDIILAYMQNGQRLAPDHGFPVRVIVPGFTGGRMVKWLRRIIVTTKESDNYYHYMDNRVIPSHVDAELAEAEGWWYKPEHVINELNTNSVITTPSHEEILSMNSWTRPYTVKGYAYSGGGKKVTRVEVTLDGGETWHVCNLDRQEKPNKYGKYWCWLFWSLEIDVLNLLVTKEIAVRAWDETHNTQPEKITWNVMGMMTNCWFRVKINVLSHKGEIGIVFEHPTKPGNNSDGWMAKVKDRRLETESTTAIKKSISSPVMNTSSKVYSMSEVKRHNNPLSAWIVVHGDVYDCTTYLNDHPGGADSILINAGTDCTEEFDAIHSDKAKKILEKYRIGEVVIGTTTSNNASDTSSPNNSVHENSMSLYPIKEITQRSVALNSRKRIPCKLVMKNSVSHDVRVFRFALPSPDQALGLPVGKHLFLCATIDGKLCMRAYTPTSSVDEVGYFDLWVKVYFKNAHPEFPNGGLLSQYLDSLPIGSVLDVKGPLGHIEYTGKGSFLVHGKPKFAKKLAMIAGGTGITPIYQVAQAILKDPEDDTEMYVIYANRTEDDILLREELDGWAKEHERFHVWYVVTNGKEGWEYSVGYITEGILREHVPDGSDGSLALVCGPPPMIQFAVQPNLEKMNYDVKNSLLIF